jgi:opacity protein-like surface antigen
MHSVDLKADILRLGLNYRFDPADAAAGVAAIPVKAPPQPWSWSGPYVGGHVGAAAGTTDFADPFGTSVFSEKVSTPTFLGGGQIGYNWQPPRSPWVLGVEADASLAAATARSPATTERNSRSTRPAKAGRALPAR